MLFLLQTQYPLEWMRQWPVSKRTPSHKSMGCQKSEDVVGLVEGRGTLRLTAEAILWVHRIFKGGLSHPSFRQKRQKRQNWLISLKNRVFHENPSMQCYEWTSWPEWTSEGVFQPDVPRGHTWGPPNCAKLDSHRGTPDNPQKWWKKNEKKMRKVLISDINH